MINTSHIFTRYTCAFYFFTFFPHDPFVFMYFVFTLIHFHGVLKDETFISFHVFFWFVYFHVISYTWIIYFHMWFYTRDIHFHTIFFFLQLSYLFTLKRYDSFICTCDLLTVLVHMWFLKINLFSYLISYTWIIYFRMWFYTHELFIFTWLFYTLFIYFHLWIYWFSCKKSHSFMFTCNFLLHD